jgi:hypothetical protein
MNPRLLVGQLRKRAYALDETADETAISRYVYPVGANEVAKVTEAPVRDATPESAWFVVTDEKGRDRDRDFVVVRGLDFGPWIEAGAPWFAFHTEVPFPIGSSLHPVTGELGLVIERERVLAKCYFDMDPENVVARHIARLVGKGLMRAVSISFVPTVQPAKNGQGGYVFDGAEISEISVVSVGANNRALLVGAPPALTKSLKRCESGKCFSKWIPQPEEKQVSPLLEAKLKQLEERAYKWLAIKRGQQVQGAPAIRQPNRKPAKDFEQDEPGFATNETGEAELVGQGKVPPDAAKCCGMTKDHNYMHVAKMVQHLHNLRRWLKGVLATIKEQEPDIKPEMLKGMIQGSIIAREHCEYLVTMLDKHYPPGGGEHVHKNTQADMEPMYHTPGLRTNNRRGRSVQSGATDADAQEFQNRYGSEDTDEDIERILAQYRYPGISNSPERSRRDRTTGPHP